MKSKSLPSHYFSQSHCCICGMIKCNESSDHLYLPLSQFRQILHEAKRPNCELDEIKQKIKAYYKNLKEEINAMIDEDSNKMQQHLNRFYYSHLDCERINLAELCEFANKKFKKLPNKKINKLVKFIKNREGDELGIEGNGQFQQVKDQIISFISNLEEKETVRKIKITLPFTTLIEKSIPTLKIKRSQSDISNPQEKDQQAAKSYCWKNFMIKNRTKVLELSNKNITDHELIREMPILSSFKHIKDFEIRNNKITSLSCKIIASNMNHLRLIDIRGNVVKDEGILALVRGIPHLKTFMISETGCTNTSALAIANGLLQLETLWCEKNEVDDEHAILLGKMPKLKVLSFAGSGLDPETAEILRKIFNCKGYVIV